MQQEKETPTWLAFLAIFAGIGLFVAIGAGASFGEIIAAVFVIPVVLIFALGGIISIIGTIWLWLTGHLKD